MSMMMCPLCERLRPARSLSGVSLEAFGLRSTPWLVCDPCRKAIEGLETLIQLFADQQAAPA